MTLLLACGGPAEGTEDASPATSATAEDDLRVIAGPLEASLHLAGELRAADSISFLAPNVNIHPLSVRWLAEDGSRIEAGDRIVEFDNSSLVNQLEDLESAIDQRETELEVTVAQAATQVAQAQFELFSARVARQRAEVEASIPENLTSAIEYANRQLELDKTSLDEREAERALATAQATAEADIGVSEIALQRAVRRERRVRDRIAQLSVVAPRSGLVLIQENHEVDRPFQVGDSVYTGRTIARLPDLDSLQIQAKLYDVDDGLVEVGMAATVVLDAFPEVEHQARVLSLEPLARQASRRSRRRVFLVNLEVEGLDLRVALPGMSSRVTLVRTLGDESSVVIPRRALRFEGSPSVTSSGGTDFAVVIQDCSLTHCLVDSGPPVGTRLVAQGVRPSI